MRVRVILLLFAVQLISFAVNSQTPIDSLKWRFKNEVLLDYWGDYVPDSVIDKHTIFLDHVLANRNLTRSEIYHLSMFPTDLIDDNASEFQFEYVVLIASTKEKNQKAYNLVFVLDSNFNYIDSKSFLHKKWRKNEIVFSSQIDPSQNGLFRNIVFIIDSKRSSNSIWEIKRAFHYGIKNGRIYKIEREKWAKKKKN